MPEKLKPQKPVYTDPGAFYYDHESYVLSVTNSLRRKFNLTREEQEDIEQECRIVLWRLAQKVAAGKPLLPGVHSWMQYVRVLTFNRAYTWLRQHKEDLIRGTGNLQRRRGGRVLDSQIVDLEGGKLVRWNSQWFRRFEEDLEPLTVGDFAPCYPDEFGPDLVTLFERLEPPEQEVLLQILASPGKKSGLMPNLAEVTGRNLAQIEFSLFKIRAKAVEIGMIDKPLPKYQPQSRPKNKTPYVSHVHKTIPGRSKFREVDWISKRFMPGELQDLIVKTIREHGPISSFDVARLLQASIGSVRGGISNLYLRKKMVTTSENGLWVLAPEEEVAS